MELEKYLDRIEINQIEKPSYLFLEKLQRHHLFSVPFENLDVIQGNDIVLNESRMYEKVVDRRRGGFCYELNGLFNWLLRKLHFSVSMASARVYEPANGRFGPEFDHMVLLVQLEKTYLVDVGFGDSFRKPISLPKGGVEDISGKYRVKPPNSGQSVFLVQKQREKVWCPEYSFTIYPQKTSDFEEMCIFHQTSPDSPFTKGPFCTIATERGRVTLSENSLTITEGVTKRKIPVPSTKAYSRMLLEHFGIALPET
jgi:N-hydroxyarylamine O-acetyltransferase